MIERKFVAKKLKEVQVKEFIAQTIGVGKYSYLDIKKTPLGEKIIIHTSRPGLVVGKKGENIKKLTIVMKNKFKMENPQIEVAEIVNPDLDVQTVADQIVNNMERFGPKRFKSLGYKTLQRIIDAGALGAEIHISGRGLPGSRAKSWRFFDGYMKKSGDVAVSQVQKAKTTANLNSGTIGIKVKIMLPNTILPDKIIIHEPKVEEQTEEKKPIQKEETEEKKTTKKKAEKKPAKKKTTKKETEENEKNKNEGTEESGKETA
ncbi:MAG: 30S ribosomal protein S3 [archaeon]